MIRAQILSYNSTGKSFSNSFSKKENTYQNLITSRMFRTQKKIMLKRHIASGKCKSHN